MSVSSLSSFYKCHNNNNNTINKECNIAFFKSKPKAAAAGPTYFSISLCQLVFFCVCIACLNYYCFGERYAIEKHNRTCTNKWDIVLWCQSFNKSVLWHEINILLLDFCCVSVCLHLHKNIKFFFSACKQIVKNIFAIVRRDCCMNLLYF